MNFFTPIIFAVVIVPILMLFFIFIAKVSPSSEKKSTEKSIQYDYEKVPLLTKYEWKNYQVMREYAAEKGLTIHVKVRLADLVNPKQGTTRQIWYRRFMRVTSKHVDFVFCDQDMNVKLIVELDDWSHQRPDRQERDQFVDAALTGAGYTIVHISAFDEAGRSALEAVLNPPDQELLEDMKLAAQIRIDRSEPTFEEWKEKQLAQKNEE